MKRKFSFRSWRPGRGSDVLLRRRYIVLFDSGIHERLRCPAERPVLAVDERQVAPDLRIAERNRRQGAGANVLLDIGPRNESDANIGGDKTLEEFARVKLHGET